MLYAYAIEPDALATWSNCARILDLMGFQHGRAIAAYPSRKRWKALVRAACRESSELGDRDRQRIVAKLRQSNAKIIQGDGPDGYDDAVEPAEECWIRNAVARQAGMRPLHAVLATRNPENHPDVVLDDDIEESHPKLDVPREVPVLREPDALAAHIGRLVRNSRELLLIDPHFDLTKSKWRSVVRACIALASDSAYGIPRVEIHTLDGDRKPSQGDFERAGREWIPRMLSPRVTSVRVCRWRIREDGAHDFHARYVLTDRGGYRLDKGLDEEHGVAQPVGLLADQEWRRIREGFRGADAFFDRGGEFTVTARQSAGRRSGG